MERSRPFLKDINCFNSLKIFLNILKWHKSYTFIICCYKVWPDMGHYQGAFDTGETTALFILSSVPSSMSLFFDIFVGYFCFLVTLYCYVCFEWMNEWMNESMRGRAPRPLHRDLQWSIVLSALILYFVVFLNNLFVFGSTKLVSCYIHIWEKSAMPRYRSHSILGNFFW